ncbi:glycosyltransferase family 2 protein [Nodosilinea sp. P-1105]|uniref:glycosyltransferase family 2 protein n=1 Tax=Nodosilinea sp. P-1105 TaxID=2546229 RepID=UPI00146D8D16|nr:glycosyltransferase family 2 protein [Nodosilinea sp. P-1105]NMF82946.1 glycosyltransferase family 2 protein [Nodosilinea sp. P-1105]
MCKISVIIPAYNSENTISETLQSVLSQSFHDFEVIIIDDGSTDQTYKIINQVDDSRIHVFQYENAGVSTARNRGISLARGEFLTFIDADDLWTNDKLEAQISALIKYPYAGVSYSSTVNMYDYCGKRYFSQGSKANVTGNVLKNLLVGNFIGSGSNILVRREAIETTNLFNPLLSGYADWEFYTKLAINWKFIAVPKNQIFYRRSINSMSLNFDKMLLEGIEAINLIYESVSTDFQKLKPMAIALMYRYCAELCLVSSSSDQAIQRAQDYLYLSIKRKPEILLENYTQKLISKFLVRRYLPKFLVDKIYQATRKKKATAYIENY